MIETHPTEDDREIRLGDKKIEYRPEIHTVKYVSSGGALLTLLDAQGYTRVRHPSDLILLVEDDDPRAAAIQKKISPAQEEKPQPNG
jgi:hypothetical protein